MLDLQSDWDEMMHVALSAVKYAGQLLCQNHASALRGSGGVKKHAKDVKLEADLIAERGIESVLCPTDIPLFSEESYHSLDPKAPLYWVVDPLDGTANFKRGLASCSCVALVQEGVPVLGVIYVISTGDVYTGSKMHSACKNNQKIRVSDVSTLEAACVLTGPGEYAQGLLDMQGYFKDSQMVRVLGSAGVSTAFVAEGKGDVYVERQRKFWDVAAGWAIVEAAGGKCQVSQRNQEDPWIMDVVMGGEKLVNVLSI